MVRIFTSDPAVIAGGVEFLNYLSWNFIPAGVVFSCSSIFQGIGNMLSVATVLVQAIVSYIWLQFELGKRLGHDPIEPSTSVP